MQQCMIGRQQRHMHALQTASVLRMLCPLLVQQRLGLRDAACAALHREANQCVIDGLLSWPLEQAVHFCTANLVVGGVARCMICTGLCVTRHKTERQSKATFSGSPQLAAPDVYNLSQTHFIVISLNIARCVPSTLGADGFLDLPDLEAMLPALPPVPEWDGKHRGHGAKGQEHMA